ncbi:MAG: hypothetical protein IJK46_14320 [Prevotella sp.]|nr:hypothetical protein [Prevotella sp.]
MTRKSITKRRYAKPYIQLKEISVEPFLTNTETLPFDREDQTGEALSKGGSIWDDFILKDSIGFSVDFDEMIEKTFNNISLSPNE